MSRFCSIRKPSANARGIITVNEDERVVSFNADGSFESGVQLWRSESTVQLRVTDASTGKTSLSRKITITKTATAKSSPSSDAAETANFRPPTEVKENVGLRKRAPKLEEVRQAIVRKYLARAENVASGEKSFGAGSTSSTQVARSNDVIVAEVSWSPSVHSTDLYVFDPYGNVDSRWEFDEHPILGGIYKAGKYRVGPDQYILTNPLPGKYEFMVFASTQLPNNQLMRSELKIRRNGKLIFSEVKLQPWKDFWWAFSLEVRELKISGTTLTRFPDAVLSEKKSVCRQYVGYECDGYIFTTQEGENEIGINASASANIDPNSLRYRVREVSQLPPPYAPKPILEIPVFGTGLSASFKAANLPLQSRTNPVISVPLVYEVTVTTTERDKADPFYIVQDGGQASGDRDGGA